MIVMVLLVRRQGSRGAREKWGRVRGAVSACCESRGMLSSAGYTIAPHVVNGRCVMHTVDPQDEVAGSGGQRVRRGSDGDGFLLRTGCKQQKKVPTLRE